MLYTDLPYLASVRMRTLEFISTNYFLLSLNLINYFQIYFQLLFLTATLFLCRTPIMGEVEEWALIFSTMLCSQYVIECKTAVQNWNFQLNLKLPYSGPESIILILRSFPGIWLLVRVTSTQISNVRSLSVTVTAQTCSQ